MVDYCRDLKTTAKAFGAVVFQTGDLAVMHLDSQVEAEDRSKDMINSGGENFSDLEVETVLHFRPDRLLAAVSAVPHPEWSETGSGVIETRDGRALDHEALYSFCRDHLAGFNRPQYSGTGPFPKWATGKIQKFLLRGQAKGMANNDPS